jgi:MoaA/NifB/PqqE/SkfB family radical SAM enzyme
MLGLETYKYINGNYLVHYNPYSRKLSKRGFRRGEELKASFPDSLDLKITNKCVWGCPWCHESSTKDGNSFSLERTKEVLSQLPRVPIEVAIGGGNVLDIPHETLELVDWMKDYGFLPRITINYKDIQSRWNKITDQT